MQEPNSNIDVVILVGGQGTRLRSVIGDDTPKPLALINGRPFLSYLLDTLRQHGFRRFILACGYKAEKVIVFAKDYASEHGVHISCSREKKALGTGGALRQAFDFIRSENVLVLNGDSFLQMDYAQLVDFHEKHSADISIGLTQVDDISRYGSVAMDQLGRVTTFIEKNALAKTEGLINGGVYVVKKHVIEKLKSDTFISMETDILTSYIGHGLYAKVFEGLFIDIGTPASFQQASEIFR